MEYKWFFPHGKNLTKTGHNNSSVEQFLDSIGTSLTREVIQNSLDAEDTSTDEPVKVKFSKYKVNKNRIPDLESITNFALPRALKMWKDNPDTLQYLENLEEIIKKNNHLNVLQISDYNTLGLDDRSYESLVTGNNFSEKNSEDSAGSKGIGKAAPFAASDLRMVFYNSKSKSNGTRAAGVLSFVSFLYDDHENNVITQDRALYYDKSLEYLNEEITFNKDSRKSTDYGVDIFIIGLKDIGNWEDLIKSAVVNNFLLSIFNNTLEVDVFGEIINRETLGRVISSINDNQSLELKATKDYYKVLKSPETITFNLPDKFVEEYSFIESTSDAELKLLDLNLGNRKILQTRKAGMKIYERSRINTVINFTGIFQATGMKLNRFLKDLENANHDKWSTDRKTGESGKEARKLLKDLGAWFRESVSDSYAIDKDEEFDAIGIRDLLPMRGNDDGDDKNIDSGIRPKFLDNKIVMRRHIQNLDGDKEMERVLKVLDELGDIESGEGDNLGVSNSKDKTGKGKGYGKGLNHKDTRGLVNDSEKSIEVIKRLDSNSLSLKLIGLNTSNGEYRLIGKSKISRKDIMLELKSVGDNGSSYDLDLIEIICSNLDKVIIKDNKFIISELSENQPIEIDFVIDTNLKLKMEVFRYEIKG